jgi:hypothetical protein
MLVPSRADDTRFRRWYAKLQRTSASPRSHPGAAAGRLGGRRASDPAADPGADAHPAPQGPPDPQHGAQPLPDRAHPRGQAGGVARRRRGADVGDA